MRPFLLHDRHMCSDRRSPFVPQMRLGLARLRGVRSVAERKPTHHIRHPAGCAGNLPTAPNMPVAQSVSRSRRRLARLGPCWPHSVGERIADPAACVAERDHLLAGHRIEVVRADLADVGPGRGLDHSQAVASDGRDDASTIVRVGCATDESSRFQPADLLGHSTRSQDRRLRQIFHPRGAIGRSGECIQNQEVGEGHVVQISESSVQPFKKKRRRLEELFPALTFGVGESRQMMCRRLLTRLSHGGRRYRTRSPQYRRNVKCRWDSEEALARNRLLQSQRQRSRPAQRPFFVDIRKLSK
jgi:hypothetical protein